MEAYMSSDAVVPSKNIILSLLQWGNFVRGRACNWQGGDDLWIYLLAEQQCVSWQTAAIGHIVRERGSSTWIATEVVRFCIIVI